MRADAPDMDLRRWNEYYFEVGMRMAELCALALRARSTPVATSRSPAYPIPHALAGRTTRGSARYF